MQENLSSENFIESIRSRLSLRKPVKLQTGSVPAAVLVPMVLDNGPPYLLLTQRAAELKHHAGEICFPGGVCNPDEDSLDTALRETWEEIGLHPAEVDILGTLDDVYSIHDYRVTPHIGAISAKPSLRLNISEICRIIEVPLSSLEDPSCQRIEERGWKDRNYPVYFYKYLEDDIWGMTAEIVRNFLEVTFRGDR